MSVPIVLPDSAESISPAWLTQVMSERYPGAVAESVEIVDAHSGTTGRARLRARIVFRLVRRPRGGESAAKTGNFRRPGEGAPPQANDVEDR